MHCGSLRTVLFIGSVGYSGSTLLDMLLGANQGVTSLGEVAKLASFYRERLKCTCGDEVAECEFWTTVEARLSAQSAHSPNNPNNPFTLADFPLLSNRTHKTIHRWIPTLAETLLILGRRALYRRFARISPSVAEVFQAASNTLGLFEVVSSMNQSPIIVDSSKEPVKLKSMFMADPVRFKLLFLVRDGRAVTLSQMKHKQIDFESAARRWVRYNRNLRTMMATIPRRQTMTMRYEDLCRDPEVEMRRVFDFLGWQPSVDFRQFRLDKRAYHNIGGNPMRRRTEEVEIRLDERWRREISPEQLSQFERIAGRWNRRFGYDE